MKTLTLRWLAALGCIGLGVGLACSSSPSNDADPPPTAPLASEGDADASNRGEGDDDDPLDGTEVPDDTPEEPADGGADAGKPTPPPGPEKGVGLDADGVVMIKATKAGGASFRLGTSNPNTVARFEIEQGTNATAKTEGKLHFWNVAAHPLSYASGGTGFTSRLHVYATGTAQKYTWKTTPGYLGVPTDLKNQEYTVYARAHTITDAARAAFTLKVRGGRHSSADGDLASCTMTQIRPGATPARFGKELTHPTYDYVALKPKAAASLKDNAWLGMKLVTYQQDATHVVYRMYVDAAPFDANGKPANQYYLFAEYVDTANKSTGKYTKLANWGGMLTTFRTDGVKTIDFAILSVREIAP